MKKILLLALFTFLFSCSSDDDGSTIIHQQPIKMLRYIKSTADWLTYNSFNSYYYENDKLVKMYNGGRVERYQFQYQNDKIWKIAGEHYDVNLINVFLEDFDYEIVYPGNYDQGEITYNGNTITRTYGDGQTISFNSDDKISQIQNEGSIWSYIYDAQGNFDHKVYTTLSNQYEFTYEFDNKINPYYILYQKFGFYEYGFSINPDVCMMDEFLFPNNITKVYKDNILVYSAIYTYDDEGYPTTKTSVDHLHSNPEYINNFYEFGYY